MNEVKGLVSITIPFYNRERFLPEAIESVLGQSYTHWELLLVDDGSTDRSTEIAHEYAAKSAGKIHYMEHKGHRNCGVTRTRNLGSERSCGEYLAFLDSDDVWLPFKLKHQVDLMESCVEAGLVYGPSEYWYTWATAESGKEENSIPVLAPGGKLYLPPTLFRASYPFGKYGAPCPSSFLLRRSSFDCVGGFVESFNPGTYQLYEDTAFLTKLYLKVPVFISDRCSDRYRCHPLSIWHRTKGTNREELERGFYFQWVRQYLLEERIVDPEIWRTFRRKSWMYSLPIPPFASKFLRRISNRLLR
jgi:glycosyltransferase involved in cell wall biosynthesis